MIIKFEKCSEEAYLFDNLFEILDPKILTFISEKDLEGLEEEPPYGYGGFKKFKINDNKNHKGFLYADVSKNITFQTDLIKDFLSKRNFYNIYLLKEILNEKNEIITYELDHKLSVYIPNINDEVYVNDLIIKSFFTIEK